jgi:hypothetical protein
MKLSLVEGGKSDGFGSGETLLELFFGESGLCLLGKSALQEGWKLDTLDLLTGKIVGGGRVFHVDTEGLSFGNFHFSFCCFKLI